MSEAQKKARALLAYATPGPWFSQREVAPFPNAYVVGCPESTVIARVSRSSEQCMVAPKRARPEHDAALIAAAPVLLAALCDENDALRVELAKVTAVVARQSSEVNGLTAEADCMEHEAVAAAARLERLRAELAAETAECAHLRAEADALRIERDVADRECDRLRAQVDADRQELTRLDTEVKRLKGLA